MITLMVFIPFFVAIVALGGMAGCLFFALRFEAKDRETIARLLEHQDRDRARIDRLTEALSYKVNVPLVMPQTPFPSALEELPKMQNSSGGWWDTKPIPAVIQTSGGKSK